MSVASIVELLFELEIYRWEAIALAGLPALLNLYILVYILRKLNRNGLTYTFALTVFSLFIWQVYNLLMRMSTHAITAELWTSLLWSMAILVVPAGLHFSLLFTEKKKLASNPFILLLIYFPLVFFEVTSHAGILQHNLSYHHFWGWILDSSQNLLGLIELIWVGTLGSMIFILLSVYAFKKRNHPIKRVQSLLIAVGFAIPTIQGIITQIIFPHILERQEVPLTSTFMTSFSIVTLIALRQYDLFQFNPRYSADQIIEQMNDGLCAVTAEHDIRFVNNRFCEITGYREAQLLSKNLGTLISNPEDLLKKEDDLQSTPSASYQKQVEIIRKGGKRLPVMLSKTAIYEREGELAGCIFIITDISNLIKAEKKLKEKNLELSTFIYRTSHDLRAPLTSIMGLTNIAREEMHSIKDAIGYLDLINKTNVKLDKTLLDLQEVGEIIRRPLNKEQVMLKDLLEGIINKNSIWPHFNDIQLIFEFNEQLEVFTDPAILESILAQILKNSYYYNRTEEGAFVRIKAKSINGMFNISIEDNGQGIPEEFIKKATQMFSRGSYESLGAGLGLYIAKNGVERLDGNLYIKSGAQKGTKVSLRFPG